MNTNRRSQDRFKPLQEWWRRMTRAPDPRDVAAVRALLARYESLPQRP